MSTLSYLKPILQLRESNPNWKPTLTEYEDSKSVKLTIRKSLPLETSLLLSKLKRTKTRKIQEFPIFIRLDTTQHQANQGDLAMFSLLMYKAKCIKFNIEKRIEQENVQAKKILGLKAIIWK